MEVPRKEEGKELFVVTLEVPQKEEGKKLFVITLEVPQKEEEKLLVINLEVFRTEEMKAHSMVASGVPQRGEVKTPSDFRSYSQIITKEDSKVLQMVLGVQVEAITNFMNYFQKIAMVN